MNMHTEISLRNAIFINLNIMLGVGIFINTVELAKKTGWIGGLLYLGVGVIMLPLILSMVALLRLHPRGNFYTFGMHDIGAYASFISTWGYFSAKLASSAIMIHTSVLLMQQVIPAFICIHPFVLDFVILGCFVGLNMLNVRTGSTIQTTFLGLKLIPILFAILCGIYLFHGTYLTLDHIMWHGISAGLPLLIYTATGFEAAVSLSSKIENSEQNTPKAILISYAIVIAVATLFQFLFFAALGPSLMAAADYRAAFPQLLAQLLPANAQSAGTILAIIYLAIASSALGGSYGQIFSNGWNLYSLAQHKLVFGSRLFTALNAYEIPWACIIAEGVLCFFYLLITNGAQIPLQQLAVLGSTITYTACTVTLLIKRIKKRKPLHTLLLPIAGIASCVLLLATGINGCLAAHSTAPLAFLLILLLGSIMFFIQRSTHTQSIVIIFLLIPSVSRVHAMHTEWSMRHSASANGMHLVAYEKQPATNHCPPVTRTAPALIPHTISLPGAIDDPFDVESDDPMLASLAAIAKKHAAPNPVPRLPQQRRKSVCVITHEETPRTQNTALHDAAASTVPGYSKPLGRRYSVTLSDISDHSGDDGNHASSSHTPQAKNMTTQISVALSPQDQEEVERAIQEIHLTEDPISKAEKQNMLLLNVTFKQFRALTNSFDAVGTSIAKSNQHLLEQMHAMAQQTQHNVAQMQTGLQEMRTAQKRQRRLNYISFVVGMCGFSFFLINFITQHMQQNDQA